MTPSSNPAGIFLFPAWGKWRSPFSLENSMFHLLRTRITRPYRTSVALEEERVWIGFYRRVGNSAIAAEVIQHLDADADQKRTHPALYLRCKESVRRKKARQARTKRIRSLMRRILGGLLGQSGSNVVSYNTWQCSAGLEQQMSVVASLTFQDGTRYQFTKTCTWTQSCSINPMNAPWQSGTWTAKADYLYVVYGDGTSGYWWGGQISAYLPY